MLATIWENPGMIVLYILLIAGFCCLIPFLLRKHTNIFGNHTKSTEEKTEVEKNEIEKKMAEEELNRILEPVDDEETLKSMEDFDKNKKDE